MAKHNPSDNADEYWDKVDPDVTGDGSSDGAYLDSPNLGELGPDLVEGAREDISKWNKRNKVKPSHEQ